MENQKVVLEVKTENEARYQVARSWGVSPDSLVVKVLDEEKAFFGLFGRRLRVEVKMAYSPEEEPSVEEAPVETPVEEPLNEPSCECESPSCEEDLIRELLSRMDLDLVVEKGDGLGLNISGPDAAIAIGKHGDTIKALEYLANLMSRQASSGKIRLDSDGYRDRREISLQRLANSAARDVLNTGRTVYLDPMTSWERRIIHMALKDRKDVETHSIGVDPDRKVAVRLTNQGRKRHRSKRP
ncbi:R3H domain-containing nucleic acid-binding protein [Dethiosulfovibrio salsuginis]|uniref:SpoIIIJ-associated protein n=1 Tax=Dethiosulfovibrio salsuginis TaxID=561720 RepID=A0A1X7ITM5_9BACT|nr:R3H domain-containing nucleic acid-binding protein [Dethiosulfovibrio salsuginis]SMG18282.1 spoIIIJ-associated protein [Dethiosulfovibrio salsuginis]